MHNKNSILVQVVVCSGSHPSLMQKNPIKHLHLVARLNFQNLGTWHPQKNIKLLWKCARKEGWNVVLMTVIYAVVGEKPQLERPMTLQCII